VKLHDDKLRWLADIASALNFIVGAVAGAKLTCVCRSLWRFTLELQGKRNGLTKEASRENYWRKTMFNSRSVLLSLLTTVILAGCASSGSIGETSRGLVGAWIVTASRPAGVGKNLLTFSSDGTFFRSGDTHPVLSGAHGAWKRIGDRDFDATYIAFRFDENRRWIGSNKTRIHIVPGPGDNEFTGVAKVSTLDLQDREVGTSEVRLEGKRIQVEP
jgi:hypothetical protein